MSSDARISSILRQQFGDGNERHPKTFRKSPVLPAGLDKAIITMARACRTELLSRAILITLRKRRWIRPLPKMAMETSKIELHENGTAAKGAAPRISVVVPSY